MTAPLHPAPPLVLIVDDEPDQRAELAFAVERLGYRALCIASGDEVLGAMIDHRPHTILLDINLPHRDGMRIAQLATGIDHRVRICLISGDVERCIEARDLALGVIAVLGKPITSAALRQILPPL